MYFETNLKVVIANKLLKTVVAIRTKNESAHVGSECELEVPINCRIQYLDGRNTVLTDYPSVLFNVGDPINITASYTGYPTVQVFSGFVADFDYGMPMKIRCADWIYPLNQGTITISKYNGSLKNLLIQVLKGTGVTLMLPVFDLTLVNITFRLMSPAAILEYLKKEIGLNISLQGSQLYVNVASNTLGSVIYRTDRNIIKANLQKNNTLFENYRVKCWFIQDNGTKTSIEVGNTTGRMREQWFYHIPNNPATYQKLATEALNKIKQQMYTGHVETYLYPDCQLFDIAHFKSIRYPDQNADYVITGNDFEINKEGWHRKLKYSFINAPND